MKKILSLLWKDITDAVREANKVAIVFYIFFVLLMILVTSIEVLQTIFVVIVFALAAVSFVFLAVRYFTGLIRRAQNARGYYKDN